MIINNSIDADGVNGSRDTVANCADGRCEESGTILVKFWPDKIIGGMKQFILSIRFLDGVSESRRANDLFSSMSHYV